MIPLYLYHVYILESETTGKWYYGFTESIEQRTADHQSNRAGYTRNKGPWRLIFDRPFKEKIEALSFERYLKNCKIKKFIRDTFSTFFVTWP